MSAPPVGKMRTRLTVQDAIRTPDGGGGVSITWSPVGAVWAAVSPIGGDERNDADGLQGRITHEIWIRYRAGLGPHMRFILGARAFDIRSVVDVDEMHRFQRCLAEERLA